MIALADLIHLTTAELEAWLVEDTNSPAPAGPRIQAEVLAAAQAGTLADDFITRWLAANRAAAARLEAEARQLELYGRTRRARITGVVRGGGTRPQ